MTHAISRYAFSNTHQAKQVLTARRQEKIRVIQAIHALKRRFDRQFTAPPARLVLLRGGGIVWRLAASNPSGQTLFELTGSIGRSLLEKLPPLACAVFLDYEQERSLLTLQFNVLSTEERCLIRWIKRQCGLRALQKSLRH